ncbi:MAG: glycogen debranching enzyme N-terminal domain-containing protein [Bacteroidetes bacterium]|jgi:predicted glycogen debranching enzyme|nr:glycogen debranching enzyme N-terminal domain-containing protein [Bacteroidota bacterium]
MSYISFEKSQLVNLEFALQHELLRSNRSGGYSSTSIAGCNTRKYHGLLVVPQPWLDQDNHVLLSALDETIIQHDEAFNFGVRMYPNGHFEPRGHKYLREFTAEPIPKITYRVGGVVLSKEMLFAENESRVLIRYTLLDAHSKTTLRLKPFLAFRNVHELTRANYDANTKYTPLANGACWQMYSGYSPLHFQLSKNADYIHVPDWYYNVEYIREKERGFPYQEDLFVPGFFDIQLKKGESILVSAGLEEKDPTQFKRQFNAEIKKRVPRDNFENCLINAAEQFIVKSANKNALMAGFPWFGTWGRDTFIALPGITLSRNDESGFKAVIDTMIAGMNGPLFPNFNRRNEAKYAAADAPLWFFWTLQQYILMAGKDKTSIWKLYKKTLITILDGYRAGTAYNIHMQDDGLIYAGEAGVALTWMDVVSDGKPVSPRIGLAIEINALWYNAVCFALELAEAAGDRSFIKSWKLIPDTIKNTFVTTFWDAEKQSAADVVFEGKKDFTVRPNMLFAVSLPYSPLEDEVKAKILKTVKSELLTERGLRSLSPKNPNYKGLLVGNQKDRDMAYHQGTVFPWLIDHFAEAWLKIHGKGGLTLIEEIYHNFEAVMFEAGIGAVSEVYDGDPPHESRGAISQAWSVAAILRLKFLLKQYDQNTK